MNATIIEKILSSASKKKVSAGDRVWADVDLIAMRDFGGPNVIQEFKNNFGEKKVFDPEKVVFTFDLHIPPRTEKVAKNQKACREFAEEQRTRLFDINHGIGQHVLFEHGLVKPQDVIIGTDSHMNLLGALQSFSTGVGTTDIVAALATGKLWFRVPRTIKIEIDGKLKKGVYAKDIILHILKNLGTSGLIYKAVEFYGSTVDDLNLAGRITLTSMVTEMSGKIGFITPNNEIVSFVNERSGQKNEFVSADKNAEYEDVLNFEVDDLEPMVACPHSPDNVRSVREVEGTKIGQVFIGSCTNGRFDDLFEAAKILKGNKSKARLIIVPATMEVAKEAIEKGLYKIFIDAGAVVSNPSCALCTIGHPGVLAPYDVLLSTSNRNYLGKIGKDAEIYLCSPATAAASAINGEITDPRG
jgi:homoaconitate hydratase family protein